VKLHLPEEAKVEAHRGREHVERPLQIILPASRGKARFRSRMLIKGRADLVKDNTQMFEPAITELGRQKRTRKEAITVSPKSIPSSLSPYIQPKIRMGALTASSRKI